MTNIAMENPKNKWRFMAGKIIYFYGPFSMAMLVITRGYISNLKPPTCFFFVTLLFRTRKNASPNGSQNLAQTWPELLLRPHGSVCGISPPRPPIWGTQLALQLTSIHSCFSKTMEKKAPKNNLMNL